MVCKEAGQAANFGALPPVRAEGAAHKAGGVINASVVHGGVHGARRAKERPDCSANPESRKP